MLISDRGVRSGIFNLGTRLSCLGMFLFSLWLLQYDISRRTVKKSGLTKFLSISILLGSVWLCIGGIMGIILQGVLATSGYRYDAFLHSILLGFVFSMIFGHAPIILPSVMKVNIMFRNSFYLHLLFLHISVIIRVFGNLASHAHIQQLGGLLNVLALLLFFFNTLSSVKNSKMNPNGKHKDTS